MTRATRWFIKQKARSHPSRFASKPGQTPTVCKHMVSGTISPSCKECFSPFPHGTCPLSVTDEYLALRDGSRRFPQNSTYSVVLGILSGASTVFVYVAFTLYGRHFQAV
jgi:hypothetical protein